MCRKLQVQRVHMLLVLVLLLRCAPPAQACLQCDRTIRLLHEDFVLSAPSVGDQIEMKKIWDHSYVTYRETSRERKGVIDPTTLYRVRTEYQTEFDRFLNTKHTGSVTFEAIQILEKGRKILEKHLDVFIRDGLCPNKCGLLKRRVMDCLSCRYKMYICPSPSGRQDCGDSPVQAEEGGQAVLDCFLPWHRLLLGGTEYHYSWAPGAPGTTKLNQSDFKTLVVTKDSSVVLNQLNTDEQGLYRCSLQDPRGTVYYGVTFSLSVAPLPDQTHRPVVTLPSPARVPVQPSAESLLLLVVNMVSALSLLASAGLAAGLSMKMLMSQQGDEGEP